MTAYGLCSTCKSYSWLPHICPPLWGCRMEWEEEFQEIYAIDAETAATKYADLYDCEGGEYAILSRRRPGDDICIVSDQDGYIQRFLISAEAIPTYYAQKITPDKEPHSPTDQEA